MLSKNAIAEASDVGFISNIFLVPKKSGEMRPVINLKRLNTFVVYEHFKMEGWQTIRDTIRKGDWMAKIDLADAYLTIPIHPSHQRFLQFFWQGRRWQFTCLPFGLSSAPRLFTKILKPILAHLRGLGIRVVAYLDDFLVLGPDSTSLTRDVEYVIATLQDAGFVINFPKSIISPKQTMEYLGLVIDSVALTVTLPT